VSVLSEILDMRSLKTKRQELKYYSRETHFTTSILLAFKIIENTKFPTQQLVCEWGNQYLSPMTLLALKIFAIKPFPSLKVYQKYFCGLGSTSGSARGAYSAPKDPLAGFWKRRWGKEREKRKGE